MDPQALVRRPQRDAAAVAAAQAEFNEKRRVWIPDDKDGFLAGWIKSSSGHESDPSAIAEVVVAHSGEIRTAPLYTLSPMNPPQFDGVEDIADLTHLNEASVIHNLRLRYGAADIYTYSGLFLISLNPYRPLPIYTPRIIAQYRSRRKEENAPHIFAVAERAWQQIGEERESQSILITGESGAGKTENTKKVIQYLAAIASTTSTDFSSSLPRSDSQSIAPAIGLPRSNSFKGREAEELDIAPNQSSLGLLEQQILQANPILEAFGNAQTMRNNNSSRFGKFIRIFFSPNGSIAGANIDWYLLEKSRVTARATGERSFHVFYQLLQGAKQAGLQDKLLLEGSADKYDFLKKSRLAVDGVDDLAEWRLLKDALKVVGFSSAEQFELFRVPALILHIGNLALTGSASDQAFLPSESQPVAEKICHLLGIPVKDFTRTVLSPKVRAGREWVTQARSKKQAEDELGALCKYMYEKTFGWMVERINTALDRPSAKSLSIGVLDIAGFEIFEENSYEQLLINFTNEKLQQFFNFHMFTLEQEEYTREGIDWDYVNFGLDLQPTIELIESSQPIGILSLLDEECIMPKATDLSFTDKVQNGWEVPRGGRASHPGSAKFKAGRHGEGFIIKHYAGDVEYKTSGWLEKNKDPINEPLARLLATSEIPAVGTLFAEYAEDTSAAPVGVHKRVKRGAFRTVGQRHKEQLGQLMHQLSTTQPHFVRCIVPNGQKKPGKVEVNLVLDQLRCNGVLEGIRIARLGYPNRHSFAEFRSRYEVLTPGIIPKGYMDGRKAAAKIAEALGIDDALYKIGTTKIFFKAGVLAELEERRDALLTDLFRRFQSAARMHMARRRIMKLINRAQAVRTIQRNARVYIALRDWPWWSLYVKVRPLLAATRTDSELVKKQAELQMAKERAERDEKEKKRLEDMKATLLAEKSKVELNLESERQLGRDKDLMLERSKQTEMELLARVKELEADIDLVYGEREQLLAASEASQGQLAQLKREHDTLVAQAAMLEKQGTDWRKRESDLLRDSQSRSETHKRLEGEKQGLVRQVEELKIEVGKREEAVKRAKERADMGIQELEKRLQLEKGKAQSGRDQQAALDEELRKARQAMEGLQQQIQRHESTVSALQRDIRDLEGKHAASQKAHQASEQGKAALQIKLDAAVQDLAGKERERQSDAGARKQLEKELDELRKTMAAKSSEDVKRQEADRSREVEMARLRDQVSALQKQLDDQRENAQQLANKLKVDVEGLRQSHTSAQRDLKATQAALKAREDELTRLTGEMNRVEGARRQAEGELRNVREHITAVEAQLGAAASAKNDLDQKLQEKQEQYEQLEDAVLEVETEKTEWMQRMKATAQTLAEESAKAQHLERELHAHQLELKEHRDNAAQWERELDKADNEIKARDSEIALLRSRENKTVVEHYHVLEAAKKVTDRQLVEQIKENDRLNTLMKGIETHRNRLTADLEDLTRQYELERAGQRKEVRAARASLGAEDKEAMEALQEERRARQAAEARVASLEKDLQDRRRNASMVNLSPARNVSGASSDAQLKLARLEKNFEATLGENERLHVEISDLRRQLRTATGPENIPATDSDRAKLLRGLQQSHDALGRDMSDQLRKLDSAPLTPSRKHNHSYSVSGAGSPAATGQDGALQAKRVRSLETEVLGLRQQLEDEREEKQFLQSRLQEAETGSRADGKGAVPHEQAAFSHFRLKAKSLRTQLDHWLAMEDLNHSQSTMPRSTGTPFGEDVLQLKNLLSQFEPEPAPLRAQR